MKVWIAGSQPGSHKVGEVVWDILGVFDTEAGARAACTKPYHFIGPLEMNVRLPDETLEWPGSFYPKVTMEC